MNVQKTAKELICNASDPATTGMKLAARIRKAAEKIENEATIGEVASTEAHVIGVGIGAL